MLCLYAPQGDMVCHQFVDFVPRASTVIRATLQHAHLVLSAFSSRTVGSVTVATAKGASMAQALERFTNMNAQNAPQSSGYLPGKKRRWGALSTPSVGQKATPTLSA
jgi:hypothetical protein